jgi:2-hydroxychromene-2-carboxylate isomerase
MVLGTERFIRRHNITTLRKNPFFPVNTLQLTRGAVAAQFTGVFEPYFRAAYHPPTTPYGNGPKEDG